MILVFHIKDKYIWLSWLSVCFCCCCWEFAHIWIWILLWKLECGGSGGAVGYRGSRDRFCEPCVPVWVCVAGRWQTPFVSMKTFSLEATVTAAEQLTGRGPVIKKEGEYLAYLTCRPRVAVCNSWWEERGNCSCEFRERKLQKKKRRDAQEEQQNKEV